MNIDNDTFTTYGNYIFNLWLILSIILVFIRQTNIKNNNNDITTNHD